MLRCVLAGMRVVWSPIASEGYLGISDCVMQICPPNAPSQVLQGHTACIRGVVWSPATSEKRQIVSTSEDKTVRLWFRDDAGQWLPGQVLKKDCTFITWSPSGRRFALCTARNTVELWLCDDARWRRRCKVYALCDHYIMATDGEQFVFGQRLWPLNRLQLNSLDTSGIAPLGDVLNFDGTLSRIMDTPDGWLVVSCTRDVHLWLLNDAGHWQLNHVRTGYEHDVISVSWSADRRQLATGMCGGNSILRWSLSSQWQVAQAIPKCVDECGAVRWSPTGQQFVHITPRMLQLWSVDKRGVWRPGAVFPRDKDHVLDVEWSPLASGGQQLCTGSRDNWARVWTVCKYDDRTHRFFAPQFRARITLLMCMFERVFGKLSLEVWLVVFQQMAALLED